MRASFFQDADLYDLEEATHLPIRVALLALECWTDRAGRFEWRRELKLNILPYDKVDVGAVLDALQTGNWVQRYEIDGKSFGVINPEFWKQQNINKNEAQSELPEPPAEVMAKFQHGVVSGGFHSYRDKPSPNTASPAASVANGIESAPTDAKIPAHAGTLEEKGREENGREGKEDQQPGGVNESGGESASSTVQESVSGAISTPEADPLILASANGDRPQGRRIAKLPAIVGKRTQVAIVQRLAVVTAELQEGTRERLLKDDLRVLQAEVVFSYWIAKAGRDPERTIFDEDRERRIIKALKMNDGDVSELLYAIDGSFKDKHLQGENDRNKKYDGIETIFRDRAIIERCARLMPGYRNKVTHPVVLKYADAVTGSIVDEEPGE